MSELQIALIVAAVLVIIGIYCLTKIQERSLKKDEEAFRSSESDALLDASIDPVKMAASAEKVWSETEGVEWTRTDEPSAYTPSVGDNVTLKAEEVRVPADQDTTQWHEPSVGSESMMSEGGDDEGQLSMPPGFDPKFDFICGVVAVDPMPGDKILEAIPQLSISKPVQWIGVSTQSMEWSPIDATHVYRYLCVGLQLADRKGPITQEELAYFCAFMKELANCFGATADVPNQKNVLERAEAVDAVCAEVDIQVGINVVSRTDQPFNGTKIRALSEASGCLLGEDGCFHRVDVATGKELFTLYNLGDQLFVASDIKNLKTNALGLTLDVALVPDGVTVFNQMLLFARQLAQTLDGRLVDINQHPINDNMIEAIRKQLGTYQHHMIEEGILPGSPLAKRLFR